MEFQLNLKRIRPGLDALLVWLKRYWWIPAGVLVLFGGVFIYALSKREAIFRERLDRVLKAQEARGLNIHIGSSGFAGLSSVRFREVSVVPRDRDTLLKLEECLVDIKIWPLLFGRMQLDELVMENGLLQVIRRDSISNIDFYLKRGKPQAGSLPGAEGEADTAQAEGRDLAALAHRLIRAGLDQVPDELEVRNFRLKLEDDSLNATILTHEASIDHKKLRSSFILNEQEATWHLEGTVDPSRDRFDLRLSAGDRKVEFPYLMDKYKLKLRFNELSASMQEMNYEEGELEVRGGWSIQGLELSHPAVSVNDILVESASVEALIRLGKNWISLDSSSTAYLRDLKFHPYLKYTIGPPRIYELGVHSEDMDAQDFFNSFPRGLFRTLEGMKVKGRLSYHLDFALNDSIPDSLRFNSELKADQFEVLEFGPVDFRKINHSFVHTPYNEGEALTSFVVGPSNPDFVPYAQISRYLKDAVNTAEDGNFFQHQGFNEDAFRQSIIMNYKSREFARGGSTISMQLVKNVFLDREKTMARKLEELLVVWLIEHERLVSKERMYEVYLNVIEWGPDIYGIGKASRFYFSKPPSQLSLPESIYLASIVPSPARFSGHWNGDGTIRSSRHWYYKLIRDIMLRRGWISQEEADNYFYGLRLNGPAEAWVRNNPIEGADEPDTLDLLPDRDWLFDDLPGLFGNPAEEPPSDSLVPEPSAEPAGSDTLSKRERRRLERQQRREARREND